MSNEEQKSNIDQPVVMRSAVDIRNRIDEIERERANLLEDYARSEDEVEQGIIAQMAMEKSLRIKDLKWTMSQ